MRSSRGLGRQLELVLGAVVVAGVSTLKSRPLTMLGLLLQTHVHIKVHSKWEPLANGTFTTGGIVHTGQFFVPDAINEQVDKLYPYVTNPIKDKWGRTRNWADSVSSPRLLSYRPRADPSATLRDR